MSWNHLLDVEVLTAILVADLVSGAGERSRPIVSTVVAVRGKAGCRRGFPLARAMEVGSARLFGP